MFQLVWMQANGHVVALSLTICILSMHAAYVLCLVHPIQKLSCPKYRCPMPPHTSVFICSICHIPFPMLAYVIYVVALYAYIFLNILYACGPYLLYISYVLCTTLYKHKHDSYIPMSYTFPSVYSLTLWILSMHDSYIPMSYPTYGHLIAPCLSVYMHAYMPMFLICPI